MRQTRFKHTLTIVPTSTPGGASESPIAPRLGWIGEVCAATGRAWTLAGVVTGDRMMLSAARLEPTLASKLGDASGDLPEWIQGARVGDVQHSTSVWHRYLGSIRESVVGDIAKSNSRCLLPARRKERLPYLRRVPTCKRSCRLSSCAVDARVRSYRRRRCARHFAR